jgi:peptidoglycan/xylan/chitin deacetylase (PgdA/CDA1 family)
MDDLLVLCYHGISDSWPADEAVTPAALEEHLEALLSRGYVGATLSQALTVPPAPRALVVSFDDAHRSVLEAAAPILAERGVPGTVFVPSAYATSGEPMGWQGYDGWLGTEHEEELRCMSWDELGGLAERGWEIGSHTRTHPRLSSLSDAEIESELRDSKSECEERLGEACRAFAYPYSDYDPRAVEAVAAAGYALAVTVPRRPAPPRPLEWPRVVVARGESAGQVLRRAWSRRLGPSAAARASLAVRRIAR